MNGNGFEVREPFAFEKMLSIVPFEPSLTRGGLACRCVVRRLWTRARHAGTSFDSFDLSLRVEQLLLLFRERLAHTFNETTELLLQRDTSRD